MQMPKEGGILHKFLCSISSIMKIGKLLDQLFTSHIHCLVYATSSLISLSINYLNSTSSLNHEVRVNEILGLATWEPALSVIPAQNRNSWMRKP